VSLFQRGKTWWTRFRVGGRSFRRTLRTRDKKVARGREADLMHLEQRRQLGMVDPMEIHDIRPARGHLDEFVQTLRSRGVTAQHLRDRVASLESFLSSARIERISEMDAAKAATWLNSLREGRLSARTVNRRLQAVRQFARWLVAMRRMSFDPFTVLRPLNERADRRRVRRALLPDEVARLFRAARDRPLSEARRYRRRVGVS
jgi:hypothetical protein